MDAINLDTQWPYTNVELTQAVNILPNTYGRVRELGIFGEPKFIGSIFVEVHVADGVLNILPIAERGGPGTVNKRNQGKSIIFKVPHIPHYASIRATDVQNRSRPGVAPASTLEEVVEDILIDIRAKHALTLEWLRMGALKGIIQDADTSTIYNLYTEFNITQKVVNFELTTPGTDVLAKCDEVLAHIEENLKGEVFNGEVHALVDATFYTALISHPNVVKFYVNWQAAEAMVSGSKRKRFEFGGITFEPYRATATDPAGNARKFITVDQGHAFPLGTQGTFQTYFAPADNIAQVNMPPDAEVFVSQEIMKHGKGIEIYSESDPLPVVRRPALLVKLTKA